MKPRTIIAATDFSSGAEAGFDMALDLARQHNAKLLVVHVVPPLVAPNPMLDEFVVTRTTMSLSEGLRDSSQEELEKRYISKAQGVDARAVLLEGSPSVELVELAKEENADLLVVGGTGVSGLAETVFGSVAQKVVRKAPCSVLVARPTQQKED